MAGQRTSYGNKRSHSHNDDGGNNKNRRRNPGGDESRDTFQITQDDTVYRYLCPVRKIGSIIGRGGEIVKQLRADTKAKIRIGEFVCPANDALIRIHQRVIAEDLRGGGGRGGGEEDDEDEVMEKVDGGDVVTAKLLVPSDQIGCVIGKGGQIVQNIRSETGAQIRILKDERLPLCALNSDELVQITGEIAVVKKALIQIASRLHDNPSRTQHLLASAVPGAYMAGGSMGGPPGGAPIMGMAPLGGYGGYKGDVGDYPRSMYSGSRDEASVKEFSVRFVCPTANIGGVIGKGGGIINQIRQDSGANIKVDSSATEGDDCLISISTREFFEDSFSPTIEAAVRLQPRCSEKVERDSGILSFTSRLLVSSSRIGCLIGKGGTIITEMRRLTKANIRILSKEDLPKIASEDDEMVQISGELDIAKDALVQVLTRLRANLFDKERSVSSYLPPVLPYLPASPEGPDGFNYEGRDGRRHGREHSYSDGYGGSSDLLPGDSYGNYGSSQLGRGGPYGAYGSYATGRTTPIFFPIHVAKDCRTDCLTDCLVIMVFLGGETMFIWRLPTI
ncbi:hypothetical protein TSUD_169650 [Trifolium subterraneum]|nr:hypothetical protein TSUD_169650 [Trifolium subterraneum]